MLTPSRRSRRASASSRFPPLPCSEAVGSSPGTPDLWIAARWCGGRGRPWVQAEPEGSADSGRHESRPSDSLLNGYMVLFGQCASCRARFPAAGSNWSRLIMTRRRARPSRCNIDDIMWKSVGHTRVTAWIKSQNCNREFSDRRERRHLAWGRFCRRNTRKTASRAAVSEVSIGRCGRPSSPPTWPDGTVPTQCGGAFSCTKKGSD